MQPELEQQINMKLNRIEGDIEDIKTLVSGQLSKKKLVSLKGMAKLLVPEKEVDNSIEEAKKSLFKGADDALRS